MKYIKIKTLGQLRKLATNTTIDCCIAVGIMRSSKGISFTEGVWEIFSSIDGNYITCKNDKELDDLTNIVKSITSGSFYAYV